MRLGAVHAVRSTVCRWGVCALGAASLVWSGMAMAQGALTSEAAVKAGFVFNFGKFTEWPPGGLPPGQIQLCLVGPDPQGAVVSAVEGRTLQGRTVSVRRNPRTEELRACQILYITDLDERRQSEALRAVRQQPVLTVGDVEGFTDLGGMIGIGAAGGRVTFEIHNEVAQAAGLKLSSQLLRLATNVRGRAP